MVYNHYLFVMSSVFYFVVIKFLITILSPFPRNGQLDCLQKICINMKYTHPMLRIWPLQQFFFACCLPSWRDFTRSNIVAESLMAVKPYNNDKLSPQYPNGQGFRVINLFLNCFLILPQSQYLPKSNSQPSIEILNFHAK